MLTAIAHLLPLSWRRYFEPMAGGAALFFQSRPSRATIADINGELINFYRVLQAQPAPLISRLAKLHACRELYYAMRSSNPASSVDRAVRFAYLNRLAWNGLYRVNRSGHFNVPIGDRLPSTLWDFDELRAASSALSYVSLLTGDFAHVLRYAREGDFVFLDPPYPRGAIGAVGFNRYASSFFTSSDHVRLSSTIKRLTKRGVLVMLALADRADLRGLYPATLRSTRVRSKALIACNGSDRRKVAELILVNY
jgi:DNA adenine methylase